MSTHKNIGIICIAATFFAIALTVFLVIGKILGIIPAATEEEEIDSGFFTANDLNAGWDTSSATKITLSDNGCSINGNGAYVHEGDVYIIYAGHYILTGELTNGTVIIDAGKTDKIWISLDGVILHCEEDAAIRVEQADKVFLTLADNTENILSSGAEYNADIIASGVDGTIYSRDDLTINGNGALVVNAAYCHGIVCNDDLVIAGGDITVSAVQDGIHANDSVRIRNAAISISAGDDGITVSNDDETAFLYVESGEISIPTCYEGMEAPEITITGGSIDIWPTDDGINASGNGRNSVIRITGGDIRITNPSGRDADGLDSNGSIYVEGGRLFISVTGSGGNCAIDYGSENGGECIVSGGTVIACGGSAMAGGFDVDSPQAFLMYNKSAAAGAAILLKDSLGQELLSEEIPCAFSSVVISMPDLKLGDTCTIEIDGVSEQITINNSSSSGFGAGGMFGGMRGGRSLDESIDQGNRGSQGPADRGTGTRPDETPPRPDNQDIPPQENGRSFSDKQDMKLPQDAKGIPPENNPEEPNGALALVGISVMTLSIGLLVAIRIKH